MSMCVGREGLRAQAVSDLPPTGWAALRPPEPAALHLQDVHLRLKAVEETKAQKPQGQSRT